MSSAASTVHHLIEERAQLDPSAVAVVDGPRRLSFAELTARANRVAHHLVSSGAGPETLVGVCLPRSADLVVTILGVLKAGAAYVPIDPGEAPARRRLITQDADVRLTLTAERLAQDRDAIDSRPATAPDVRVDPGNLAYVIYTSGSTGTPKGVLVQHSSAVNYLRWADAHYAPGAAGGVPFHSAVNTDLSVTSLFTPLVAGRPVIVVPEEDPPVNFLPRALAEGGHRFVKLTPAHLELLADALAPEHAAGATHHLIVGGDALHYRTLDFWRRHAGDTVVVNEYGPTETTVACCAHEFPAAAPGDGPVPIGTAIAGAKLIVLDEALEPVPDGQVGELYVGGPPVSRGYLGRPGLTAASFLPDPAGNGARMYRTGDLVHRDQAGRLVFRGRADHQIKLRGYRIEPGEVEAVLTQHPGVRAAAVSVRNAGTGRAALVAHVVPEADGAADDVLAFAAERLPAHMVPASVRPLDALPLTRQGKVDRTSLDEPEKTATSESGPRTELEEAISEMFADLLGTDGVDTRTSFLDLGGNSLLAARLVARMVRAYQVDLPVSVWLDDPSVVGFATLIDTYRTRGPQAAVALAGRPELDDLDLDDEIVGSLHVPS